MIVNHAPLQQAPILMTPHQARLATREFGGMQELRYTVVRSIWADFVRRFCWAAGEAPLLPDNGTLIV